ncbi:MAG: DinB family protein [Alphaproteobacteria bacterium]|nr:DinB family protein [Alphaproteobacteria bacterium]
MTASLLTELLQFSRYNRIANRILYECLAEIPEDDLKRTRPNTDDSVFAILNHILVVDRDWMNRFTGVVVENVPRGEILHDTLAALRDARTQEDERIEEFVENLSIAFLSTQFRYQDAGGQYRQDPADRLVVHMFVNQIHHRGRIEAHLLEMGQEPPLLDFHILLRG